MKFIFENLRNPAQARRAGAMAMRQFPTAQFDSSKNVFPK
jgi:hypothetical protein